MNGYHRFYIPNATWFFTVNLAERKNNNLLIEKIHELRDAFRYVKKQKPFRSIWTLPEGDSDYSIRWNMLKGQFSRTISKGERISKSRQKRRERGLYPWAQVATPILGSFNYRPRRF